MHNSSLHCLSTTATTRTALSITLLYTNKQFSQRLVLSCYCREQCKQQHYEWCYHRNDSPITIITHSTGATLAVSDTTSSQ